MWLLQAYNVGTGGGKSLPLPLKIIACMKKTFTLFIFVVAAAASLTAASRPQRIENIFTPQWAASVVDVYCEAPYENILYRPGGWAPGTEVDFTSSDPTIAEYDAKNECVIGHKAGTTTIVASFPTKENESPVSCTVRVVVPQASTKSGNVLTFDKEKFRVTLEGGDASFYLPGSQTDEYYIPGKVAYGSEEYTVTKIAAGGMKGKEVRTVIVPGTVTEIGAEAFAECYSLTSLKFFALSNVETIGDKAFYHCSSLKSPDLPASLVSIGDFAFAECFAVTKFVFQAKVSHIGEGAFADCINLQCFDERSNPYLAVGLPGDMAGPGILFSADWKELIAYPNKINDYYNIFGFSDTYEIYKRVETVRPYAFSGCTSLRGVTIPATVKAIGAYAFQGCPGISSITLPASITRIEEGTFNGCEGLASVDAPATLTYVGKGAFPDNAPKDFTVRATTPPAIVGGAEPEMFSALPAGSTLHVPAGCENAYKSAAIWNYYPIIAGFGTNGIDDIAADAGDSEAPAEIYTTAGQRVGSDAAALPAGLYIQRRGSQVSKIIVR